MTSHSQDNHNRDKNAPHDKSMSLLEHIAELRLRLIRSAAVLLVAFIVCFSFSAQLLEFLSWPLQSALAKLDEKNLANKADQPLPAVKESLPALVPDEQYQCTCQLVNAELQQLNCSCQPVDDLTDKSLLPDASQLDYHRANAETNFSPLAQAIKVQTCQQELKPEADSLSEKNKTATADKADSDEATADLKDKKLPVNSSKAHCFNNFIPDPLAANRFNYGDATANSLSPSLEQTELTDKSLSAALPPDNPTNLSAVAGDTITAGADDSTVTPFVFLGLPDVFIARVKIAFWTAILIAIPYFIAEIWGFVAPAMYRNERKIFLFILLGSIICFLGGAVFGYSIVFPVGFDFFLQLGGGSLAAPTIAIDNYLGFALMLLLVFGVVFELPVLCLILAQFGIINAPLMLKYSRIAIVGIFFIAAIFSPPDPLSMLLMGFPLVGLYFFKLRANWVDSRL